MPDKPIYLDYAATTPLDPEVLDAMMPYLTHEFGNAASRTHAYGWKAEEAINIAREQVADLISAKPEEILFTSGSTEGINLALKGLWQGKPNGKGHIITSKTEHKAILDTCKFLESQGAEVTYLDVDPNGIIDFDQLASSISERTVVVAIMQVNNETGVIQDIRRICDISSEHNAYVFCDATQGAGKIECNVGALGIDLLTLSGHKMYGPKGVGALYVRQQYPKIELTPLIHGGGHEHGLRSGTMNVPGVVGLGEACRLRTERLQESLRAVTEIRDGIENELMKLEGVTINGTGERSPYISSVCFEGIDAESLVMAVRDELAIANGSACTSAEVLPSHVLMAMHKDEEVAYSSVRISYNENLNLNCIQTISKSLQEACQEISSAFS